MLKLFVIVILALIGSAWCQEDNEEVVPFITGGVNTVWGEFPSVVSIDSPFNLHCQGVVVNNNHVLTSARCITSINETTNNPQVVNPFWLRIIAGDLNLIVPTFTREVRGVTHIYPHAQFNHVTGANDIAVIRLDQPFPNPHNTIEAAVRNTRIFPDGTVCRFAGWGAATVAGAINSIQTAINAPIMNRINCIPIRPQLVDSQMCAGVLTGAAPIPTTCTGNVGGGLFCNGELTGILSYGVACGVANTPSVYTQVRFMNDWIDIQFNRTDFVQPGTTFPIPPASPPAN